MCLRYCRFFDMWTVLVLGSQLLKANIIVRVNCHYFYISHRYKFEWNEYYEACLSLMAAEARIGIDQNQNSIIWNRQGKGRSRWVRDSAVCKEDVHLKWQLVLLLAFSLFLLGLFSTLFDTFIILRICQRLPCQLSNLLWLFSLRKLISTTVINFTIPTLQFLENPLRSWVPST